MSNETLSSLLLLQRRALSDGTAGPLPIRYLDDQNLTAHPRLATRSLPPSVCGSGICRFVPAPCSTS